MLYGVSVRIILIYVCYVCYVYARVCMCLCILFVHLFLLFFFIVFLYWRKSTSPLKYILLYSDNARSFKSLYRNTQT